MVRDMHGFFFDRVELARAYVTAPILISFSKIKVHNICGVTGGIKNLFGSLPIRDKSRLHPFLEDVLCDLLCIRSPDLTILDGNPAMEGDGPVRGDPVSMRLTLWGNDSLATDIYMTELMGLSWKRVQYLRLAAKRQLGVWDLGQVEIIGRNRGGDHVFRTPGLTRKVFVRAGLCVQRWGYRLESIGHIVHGIRSVRHLITRGPRLLVESIRRQRGPTRS
jgi:uncharacterized protein (DUF362 family)